MKATAPYNQAKDVDPLAALTEKTRHHIDHWLSKFPPDRKRSALIAGPACCAGTERRLADRRPDPRPSRKYLDLPPVWAYEVASFYSMFETPPVGRNNVAICTNISCWLNGAEDVVRYCEKKLGVKLGEVHG